MRYLSVCSGIEAASCAWHPLGWEPVAFAEIDRFPAAVLAHHYPSVPNWGDLTKFAEWPDADVDVLVGGTPCQSFSVAGLRAGLADPRGNLALTYLAVLDRYRPTWCCWENVPGVLSADDGRALGAFLGGLGQLWYGFAYRVLDAQHFGLAQRRARVFVVGHLGDWRRAAAVLFERESLSGHPAPRREAGQVAPTVPSRRSAGGGIGTDFDRDGGALPVLAFGGNNTRGPIDVATAVNAHGGPHGRQDFESETFIAHSLAPAGFSETGQGWWTEVLAGLRADPGGMPENVAVTHSLRADGFDASEDGTGRGTPIVPVAYVMHGYNSSAMTGGAAAAAFETDRTRALDTTGGFAANQGGTLVSAPYTLAIRGRGDSHDLEYMQVRRLTPRECERLQGFPDDYTLIPYRGKPAADGPRYKALGNSMAVPVMAWIGRRIQMVSDLDATMEATA